MRCSISWKSKLAKVLELAEATNVLLHMATKWPERVMAMASPIMRHYRDSLSEGQWEILRRSHPGGDAQIHVLLASTQALADSYADMKFTPPYLSTI